MRTALILTAVSGSLILFPIRSNAEVVPTNSENVAVSISTGVKLTNIVALGTNAPSTQVLTVPLMVTVPAYEGMERLDILTTSDLSSGWTTNASSATTNLPGARQLVGYDWTNGLTGSAGYVRASVTPISDEKLLASIAFNRLAYGPTPYELAEVLGVNADGIIGGPGATGATKTVQEWINEQLNPWTITEDVTNQFSELAALGARFSGLADVILSNTTFTNITFDGTNFVTNTTPNTETNGPGTLSFHNFRAWYAMHCVGARRQLLEVLLYWLENHHVSQWRKARDTFSGVYNGQASDIQNRIPTAMESREHMAFRTAMLKPNVTWRELLYIQHESQSMTVYLDTNDSRGNGENIANENYAREILELFCMGVDNGYDQRDITALSAVWTGWDVQKVHTNQAYWNGSVPVIGLYASETNAYRVTASGQTQPGVFALQFRPSFHCNSNIYAFYKTTNGIAGTRGNTYNNNYPNGPVIPGTNGFKYIDSRFKGIHMNPPYDYTTKLYGTNTVPGSYALFIPRTDNGFLTTASTNAARTNKAYRVMDHIADLPYTQEFISVKLCRLLVHDNFSFGATGYDFSDTVVTPEEQLVWDCMMAWENPPGGGPKGQIWKVVKAITDSPLFRSQAAQGSKIKTPLEFTMSAVRALRISTNGTFNAGSFSSDTDGYTIVSGNSSTATSFPLNRMGRYLIFDREEPDGYPETGTAYVGAGALAERNRWISTILDDNQSDGISGGGRTRAFPTHLLAQFVPLAKRNDPDIVARFFLSCLFPGEGEANLDYYRRRAIDILDTSLAGTYSAGSFRNQTLNSTEYNFRVNRMVAFLMTMPRFHEQ
jgi:hypothetical protein